jgi:hypothetical protein
MAQSEENKSIVTIAKEASSLGCRFAKCYQPTSFHIPELET